MKKFFIIISIIVVSLSSQAKDFKAYFYDLLDKGDTELAEIFLAEWESNEEGNPELFLAKATLLLAKSYISSENSNCDTEDITKKSPIIFEPNDSILQLALETLKRGIEVFPNRLDFRLAEAQACQYNDDPESLSKLGIDILEHSRINGCRWDWSDGESLNAEEGLKNMLDGIHAMEYYLYHRHSFKDDLLNLNLKYYPSDSEALLFKGMTLIDDGKYKKARHFLEFANEQHPDDYAVMFYLGVVYSKMGEKEKEKEILKKIVESDNADEKIKQTAKAILEGQDSNLKEMDLYRFEFNFLIDVADTCVPSADSIEILSNEDDAIFYLLEQIGYYLSVQGEIKIDIIGEGDEGIVVWTMPEPKEIPLARYIAFVPDKEANNYRLYTLERSLNWDDIDPVWILGYCYNGGHSNFGEIPYPSTPEEFVGQVLKVFNEK